MKGHATQSRVWKCSRRVVREKKQKTEKKTDVNTVGSWKLGAVAYGREEQKTQNGE